MDAREEFEVAMQQIESAVEPWKFIATVSPDLLPRTPWELYLALEDALPFAPTEEDRQLLYTLTAYVYSTYQSFLTE